MGEGEENKKSLTGYTTNFGPPSRFLIGVQIAQDEMESRLARLCSPIRTSSLI